MFLDHFDFDMSMSIFFKKKHYFNIFLNEKHFEKQPTTTTLRNNPLDTQNNKTISSYTTLLNNYQLFQSRGVEFNWSGLEFALQRSPV